MTELPIVVNTNEITVGGMVDQIELKLESGSQGVRGSRIFSGDVSPLTLPANSPFWAGYTEFIVGDVYVERSATNIALWEWKSQPGGYTWVKTADIAVSGGGGITELDPDLTAIADLTGTTGILRKSGVNTWLLDTNSYLTSNQTITLSGDVSGSGTTSISTTLANSGVTAGTYNNNAAQVRPFTVDAKGRITGIGSAVPIAIAQSAVTNLTSDLALKAPLDSPTFIGTVVLPSTTSIGSVSSTELGYVDGVTSSIQTQLNGKQPLDADLTSIAGLAGTSGLLKKTAADTWTLDTNAYLTANQTITLSGVVTGSGSTSITTSFATSPAFSGTPTAPTAAVDTNTTQIATTAYVVGQGYLKSATASSTYLPLAGGTLTGKLTTVASASGNAGINLPHGAAPSSPTNGDIWTTTAGMYVRVNGTTVGPFGTGAVWGSITGTLSSQTDLQSALNAKQAADNDLTAIAALAGTSGFLKKTATDTWALDTNAYITGNQTITLGGDLGGSGTTSITATLNTVNSNVGTFGSATQVGTFTVNAKGLITAASNVSIAIAQSAVTNLTTDLAAKAPLANPVFVGTDSASNYAIKMRNVATKDSALFLQRPVATNSASLYFGDTADKIEAVINANNNGLGISLRLDGSTVTSGIAFYSGDTPGSTVGTTDIGIRAKTIEMQASLVQVKNNMLINGTSRLYLGNSTGGFKGEIRSQSNSPIVLMPYDNSGNALDTAEMYYNTASSRWQVESDFRVDGGLSVGNVSILSGTGNPEGSIAAAIGSEWTDTNTGIKYDKMSSGTTGWVPRLSGAGYVEDTQVYMMMGAL